MPRYMIEREIPGAGSLGDADCVTVARRSNEVLKDLGPSIQWIHSYVTGDRIYCVYDAPNTEIIREHARRGGFPADSVAEVCRMLSPAMGQGTQQGAESGALA